MLAFAVFNKDYSFDCRVRQDFGYTDMECSSAVEIEPTAYFRMALVKCICNYLKVFCEYRKIDIAGLAVETHFVTEEYSDKEVDRIDIRVRVPVGFPAKYVKAMESLVAQCRIIGILSDPPEVSWKVQDTAESRTEAKLTRGRSHGARNA